MTVNAPSISVRYADAVISEHGGHTQFIVTRNFRAPIELTRTFVGPAGTAGLRGNFGSFPMMGEGITQIVVPFTAEDNTIVDGDFAVPGYGVAYRPIPNDPFVASNLAFITILDDEFLQVESVLVNNQEAAAVSAIEVNQRSRVMDLTITLNGMATIAHGSFVLTRYKTFDASNKLVNDATDVGLVQTVRTIGVGTSNPKTQVILTFKGPITEYGSLSDGLYRLTINSGGVKDVPLLSSPRELDGDRNNVAGGNYANDSFFRLFGDSDGNGVVDAADNLRFRDYAARTNRAGVSDWYRWYFDFDDSLTKDSAGNRTAYNAIDGAEFNKRLSKRKTT